MPAKPALPTINADKLASLDDDTYWTLEDRERRLTDWAYEQQAMLNVLCSK
ncbi:hypothetical protein [Phytohalomonas tamaricis]|uniref:hypothetical protein n=1 Tax=Phytohalomonas tamaricis TaxID=2081032 RepID=UPI001319E828|nr:hypothetical protein [Phytohalomonas tamaricis]